MGTLADAVAAEHAQPGQTCRFCALFKAMTPADQADVVALLDDRTVPAAAITRGLRKHGADVYDGAVAKHRRDECITWRASRG